jgi:DNA-binding LacI/PurR family transcriptional regulator
MEKSTRNPGGQRATIKDVAAALNVAVSTVSNAYNRPDQLSAALRERVFATADALGYPGPNPVARSLRTRSAGTVLVLLGQPLAAAFKDSITAETLGGIAEGLSATGYTLQIVPSDSRAGLPAADGAIVLSPDLDDPLGAQLIRHGQPTVLVDLPEVAGAGRIGVDDQMAARAAMGHLTGLGHTRIAVLIDRLTRDGQPGFVKVKKNPESPFPRTVARLKGFRAGAEAAGIDWADVAVFAAGDSSESSVGAALDAILDHRKKTSAILSTSDDLAAAAISAARAREIAVPGRLSVVGFDDSPSARTTNPPLTTVRQPHAAKGQAAAAALLARLRGEDEPAVGRMAPKIVVRGSSSEPGK